jgi:hypothetical protein
LLKENYHYCDLCDYDEILENGYCSVGCMKKSEDFKELKRIYLTLSREDRKIFSTLIWKAPSNIFEYLEEEGD